MKPQRPLQAAGLAASHCEQLFRQRAEPVDLLPEFGRLGERLAREFGPVLSAFAGGQAAEVQMTGVERMSPAELGDAVGALAANSLMTINAGKNRLLFSIDGGGLLAQLDRAFGGTGAIAGRLPAALPLSADLLAQRVEHGVAVLLGQLLDTADTLSVVERDGCYATLAPFREGETLAVLSFEVADAGAQPLTMRLAASNDSLAGILPPTEMRRRAPRQQVGPLDGPFSDITLTLEAVLSEIRIPLSRIATLAPGQTLPIPVAREVPLRIGGRIVARGTIGELDDRVALQITNSISSRKDTQ